MRAWLERHPALALFLAGLLTATALPPVHFYPGLLGIGLLLARLHEAPRFWPAFVRATLFGFGFQLAGLYWVGIAFFVDAERFGALAVPAVLLLCLGLGGTIGLAAAVTALRRWRHVEARTLAFAVAWTVAELVRGRLGLQFPWNPIAVVWAGSDLTLQAVAYTGTYGLSLLTVAAVGLTARFFRPGHTGRPWTAFAAPAVLVVALLAAGAWRLHGAEDAATKVRLRIVQANVGQHHKWDPQKRVAWFRRHLELSLEPTDPPLQVIVWPESAVPYEIENEPEVRRYLAEVTPPGGLLLVGGDRFEREMRPLTASNSLWAVDGTGTVLARYDKVDLVPFGEFMPFRPVLGAIGLKKLTQGTIDFAPGPGRVTLHLPGLPPVSPLICYEAIFAADATAPSDRPAWLVNITNDAWFGTSSGPYQHLAMARMRAIEEGLPLARAANTGISVVTDAYGRIQARLGLNETGIIDAALPKALDQPSFARRLHPWLLIMLLVALTGLSFLVDRTVDHAKPSGHPV